MNNRKNKGQFLIITALLITVLTLALVISVQQTAFHRITLRYKPVNELLLGLSSDMERSLTHALSLYSKEIFEGNSLNAEQIGENFILTWKKAVMEAYSNLGLNLGLPFEPHFNFEWSYPIARTWVNMRYDIDVDSYGFIGWEGVAIKKVILEVFPETEVTDENTTIHFQIQQSTTDSNLSPISNLNPENILIGSYIHGYDFSQANILNLQYFGNGLYSLTFDQLMNPSTNGVSFFIKTPDDGIYVGYSNYDEIFITLDVMEETGNPEKLGTIELNDVSYSDDTSGFGYPIPIFPITYSLVYTPEPGYTFQRWETSGEVTIQDSFSHVTLIEIAGNCSVIAIYSEGTFNPPIMNISLTLDSFNTNETLDHHLGSIQLNETSYVDLPMTVEFYDVVDYLDFEISYIPENSSFNFLFWDIGDSSVLFHNAELSQNILRILGNSSLTAFYKFVLPDTPEPPEPPEPPPPEDGDWSTLYFDRKRTLVPYELWTAQEGHDESHSSTGNLKQVSSHITPPTPYNITHAQLINVSAYITPVPPKSVKNLNFTIGFEYEGTYYRIATEPEVEVDHKNDLYYVQLISQATESYVEGYGIFEIPQGSIIMLTIEVTFVKDNGFLFVYHGYDRPSIIELY